MLYNRDIVTSWCYYIFISKSTMCKQIDSVRYIFDLNEILIKILFKKSFMMCYRRTLRAKGFPPTYFSTYSLSIQHRLFDSLVVECWHRVRGVPGSIPSQGPRHTKDVKKMVPVVPLFSTQHWKGKYWLFLKN